MVRRWFLVGVMFLITSLLVVGCGIPQEQHDAVVADRDAAEAQVASLQSDLAATESDLAAVESDLAATEADLAVTRVDLVASESEVTRLDGELAAAESEATKLDRELTAAEAQVSSLESQLSQTQSYPDAVKELIAQGNPYGEIVNVFFRISGGYAVGSHEFIPWVSAANDPNLQAKWDTFQDNKTPENLAAFTVAAWDGFWDTWEAIGEE